MIYRFIGLRHEITEICSINRKHRSNWTVTLTNMTSYQNYIQQIYILRNIKLVPQKECNIKKYIFLDTPVFLEHFYVYSTSQKVFFMTNCKIFHCLTMVWNQLFLPHVTINTTEEFIFNYCHVWVLEGKNGCRTFFPVHEVPPISCVCGEGWREGQGGGGRGRRRVVEHPVLKMLFPYKNNNKKRLWWTC